MEMLKLGYDRNEKAVWMKEEEVKKYYEENKESLLQVRFKPEFGGAKGRVVANYSGWVTMATENGALRQGWAGDFITGWE